MTLVNAYRRWWLGMCIGYYKLALQHIDPCHPDVPEIIHALQGLSDQLDQLKGAA